MGFGLFNEKHTAPVTALYEQIEQLKLEHKKEIDQLKQDFSRKFENQKFDFEFTLKKAQMEKEFDLKKLSDEKTFELKKLSDEKEMQIQSLKKQLEQNQQKGESDTKNLTDSLKNEYDKASMNVVIERDIANQKVAYLEKAFDTLGFDVKDMKSILDKLVDGLIAKNEINIIK